jgi:hypothetical protein
MLDNLTGLVSSALSEVSKAFLSPFGGKKMGLRYPLGDEQKFQNIIKFTAIIRQEKSSVVDKFAAPAKFVESSAGSVSLYMPAGLQVSDNLSYDSVDTGLGGMLVNAYQNSAGTSEFLKTVVKESPELANRAVAQKLASAAQSRGMGGGAAGQLLINAGEVTNPHTEMLFKSPALRQFNFNFKMIPRTRAEAKEIIKIVQFFRVAAYPSLGGGARNEKGQLNMATYKFPDKFKITYLTSNKVNPNLIKFKDAYLTAISVNYNQTSPTFFDDGMPSEIDLSLTFQETKAISREDVSLGY